MKKTKRVSCFLLAVVLCLATFIGFARNTKATTANAADDDEIVVGVSMPLVHEQLAEIGSAIELLLSMYDITTIMCDSGFDSELQVLQIQDFIAQEVDAIIVKPVIEGALVNVLNEAASENIAIIVFGQNHGYYQNAVYVDFDNVGGAEQQVENFMKRHPDPSEILEVLVIVCNEQHGTDYFGWIEALCQDYGIKYTSVRVSSVDELATAIESWLANTRGRLPDAIFTCCDARAHQVADILEMMGFESGPDGMPIYGFESDCSCEVYNLVDLILNLTQQLLNGDIKPTGGEETHRAGLCQCRGDQSCGCMRRN